MALKIPLTPSHNSSIAFYTCAYPCSSKYKSWWSESIKGFSKRVFFLCCLRLGKLEQMSKVKSLKFLCQIIIYFFLGIVVCSTHQIRSLTFLILSLTEDFVQFPMIQPVLLAYTQPPIAGLPSPAATRVLPVFLLMNLFDSLSLQFLEFLLSLKLPSQRGSHAGHQSSHLVSKRIIPGHHQRRDAPVRLHPVLLICWRVSKKIDPIRPR